MFVCFQMVGQLTHNVIEYVICGIRQKKILLITQKRGFCSSITPNRIPPYESRKKSKILMVLNFLYRKAKIRQLRYLVVTYQPTWHTSFIDAVSVIERLKSKSTMVSKDKYQTRLLRVQIINANTSSLQSEASNLLIVVLSSSKAITRKIDKKIFFQSGDTVLAQHLVEAQQTSIVRKLQNLNLGPFSNLATLLLPFGHVDLRKFTIDGYSGVNMGHCKRAKVSWDVLGPVSKQ